MTCPATLTVSVQPGGLVGQFLPAQSMTLSCRLDGKHKQHEPLLPPGVRISGPKGVWKIKL